LREALEAVLPEELGQWVETARALRPQWKAERIPMEQRRPLLLEALNRIYGTRLLSGPSTLALRADARGERSSVPFDPVSFAPVPVPVQLERSEAKSRANPSGFVWLVGAGPGDPELITLKAARVLAQADLILYDALVSPEILALAPKAHRFFVGKRAKKKSMKQQTIHKLLIRAARRGKKVVRLKCGDPFVFGRGGEEALALHEARIPFEVVPGISSAIAAPALAGIPVTHRGLASSFTLVSGHSPEAYRPAIARLSPNASTLVVLMGKGGRGELAAYLMSLGWSPRTPSALLLAASTPRAHTWTGALCELGAAPVPESLEDAPGTVCIGEVVQLARVIGKSEEPSSFEETSQHGSR
jgi:uroporphyrin-III C-methyltransferase